MHRIFHSLRQEPFSPTGVEIGLVAAGEALAECREGVAAEGLDFAPGVQTLARHGFQEVAIPRWHWNCRGNDFPGLQDVQVSISKEVAAIGTELDDVDRTAVL